MLAIGSEVARVGAVVKALEDKVRGLQECVSIDECSEPLRHRSDVARYQMARYITSLDEDAVDIVARIHQLTTQLDDLIQHQQVKAEETVVLGESIDADEEHAARVALVLEDTVESLLGRQAVVFTELQDLSTLMDLGHSGNIDMYVGNPPSTCIPLDGSKQFFGDYPWLQVGKTGWMVEFDASTDRPWFRTVYVYAFSPRHPPEDFTMGVPIEVSDSVWAAGAEFCVYP